MMLKEAISVLFGRNTTLALPEISSKSLKQAYRSAVKEFHPDASLSNTEKAFQRVNEAYQKLCVHLEKSSQNNKVPVIQKCPEYQATRVKKQTFYCGELPMIALHKRNQRFSPLGEKIYI